MSTPLTGDSLGALAENARTACKAGPITNFLIEGRYDIEVLDDRFLSTYRPQAQAWQSKARPAALYISHGEYIHRHGDGIQYLIDQLVKKPTGNRAIISLIDMKDLIGSEDDPRPSFMIFQAGFESGNKALLHVTTYYRALEVSRFLPINLAETCLILKKIQEHIPEVRQFHLLIHAFRAYQDPDFNCLVRSALDVTEPAAIESAIKKMEVRKIHEWLHSKLAAATVVETDALTLLRDAIGNANDYPETLLSQLNAAILELGRLATLRRTGSHVELLPEVKARADRHLTDAMNILEGMKQWS
jgi:hypothetical protein